MLDAQGTKREHYSVVEASRAAQGAPREHTQQHRQPQQPAVAHRPATSHRHTDEPKLEGLGDHPERLEYETEFAAGENWLDPAV